MQPAQPSPGSSTATSTSASPKLVKHLVLFDSFAFSASQLNYGTYKKELCVIVEFARKYYYLFHVPEPSIILTDHKPLTFFIDSPLSEGIYARWASELQALHTKIEWIPGKKNSVADALSRTIFPDLQPGQSDAILDSIGHLDPSLNWVWKDGKGGYEELLKLRPSASPLATAPQEEPFVQSLLLQSLHNQIEIQSPWALDRWYGDVYRFMVTGHVPPNLTRLQRRQFQVKCSNYQLLRDELYFKFRGEKKRCVREEEVAELLHRAHDQEGHFGAGLTLHKLKRFYWPQKTSDVKQYILGCIKCAKHSVTQRSQKASPIHVYEPHTLLGMDFIGPFTESSLDSTKANQVYWPQITRKPAQ
jgi:hypothetical protein